MADTDDKLRDQVGKSGFPFQRKIVYLINSTTSEHGWSVESPEHAWRDDHSGTEGFIDMVVANETRLLFERFKIIIECKRPGGGQWIFLVDKEARPVSRRIKCRWMLDRSPEMQGWHDFRFHPSSLESSDCIVPGQNSNDRPTLERIASDLLRSTHALSFQEDQIRQRGGRASPILISMIVTAVDLFVCHADPGDDITMDGMLKEGATLEPVRYMRFRKSLTTELTGNARPMNLGEENLAKERTILVVNVHHIVEVLRKMELLPPRQDQDEDWPWNRAGR
jgi:hypothetical protein